MTSYSRRLAAVALAFLLSIPVFAGSPADERGHGADRSGIVRMVEKVKKILGISTNSDLPAPPVPAPKP